MLTSAFQVHFQPSWLVDLDGWIAVVSNKLELQVYAGSGDITPCLVKMLVSSKYQEGILNVSR
jgi:hypothetical protein